MTSRKASLLCAAAVLAALVPLACAACDTALLVIDVQNAYVRTLDLTTIDGIPLVDRLVEVIATARAAGLPVIYIQQRDPRFSVGSPDLAIPEAIAPRDGDPTIWKSHPDAFRATDLQATLVRLGTRRLLICGLATTGCVDATVFGAIQHTYETWVLADAHSGGGSLQTLAYYNSTWPVVGATVVRSDVIDFAALACAAPPSP
ncbi:MAG: isochorismatase family protein [Candidatus Bipolaricaulis sp.]|nr:isochorismatase family protein [Candidatus Bipolaricaulis sp.]